MRVSYGICAYNEEANIAYLLENLLAQPLPSYAELCKIIIVSSGSTDRTNHLIKSFGKKDDQIILIEELERNGKASAINEILKEVEGDVLVIVAADNLPAEGSVALLVERLYLNNKVGAVSARPIPVNHHNDRLGCLVHLIWKLHHRQLSHLIKKKDAGHVSGEMFAMRTGVITKIPPVVINDDAYIALTFREREMDVNYCPDAVVFMKAPETVLDFVAQRRRVVFGHHQLTKMGLCPKTLEGMFLRQPLTVFNILFEELRESPKEALELVKALFLEGIVNVLALLDKIVGRRHLIWKTCLSTKSLEGGKYIIENKRLTTHDERLIQDQP